MKQWTAHQWSNNLAYGLYRRNSLTWRFHFLEFWWKFIHDLNINWNWFSMDVATASKDDFSCLKSPPRSHEKRVKTWSPWANSSHHIIDLKVYPLCPTQTLLEKTVETSQPVIILNGIFPGSSVNQLIMVATRNNIKLCRRRGRKKTTHQVSLFWLKKCTVFANRSP